MGHYEKKWTSFDGLSMYSQTWGSTCNFKGVINLIHGLGEHSSRYTGWAKKFTDYGYTFRSFDLRGHGKSDGKHGYSANYEDLIFDISDFIQMGSEEFPSVPIFLYGHSLGGNLLINYTIQNMPAVNGMIITSPWLELEHKLSPATKNAIAAIGRSLPALQVNNGLKIEDLSRDQGVVRDYNEDPLVHDRITIRLALQIIEAGLRAESSIHKVNIPMLIMHGSCDQITSCRATRNFVCHSAEKTEYIEWEGGFHELHNDLDSEKVFDAIIRWIDCKL